LYIFVKEHFRNKRYFYPYKKKLTKKLTKKLLTNYVTWRKRDCCMEISSKALADASGLGLALKITQPYHLISLNLPLALGKTGKPVDMIRDSESMDEDKQSRSKR
jgi:hypothetical protein